MTYFALLLANTTDSQIWGMPVDKAGLWVQLGVALIVLIYTIVTAKQYMLARRTLKETSKSFGEQLAVLRESNEVNRRAMILGRRAWLNVEIIGQPLEIAPKNDVVARIANVGMVPTGAIELGSVVFLASGVTPWAPVIPDITLVEQIAPLGVRQSADYRLHVLFKREDLQAPANILHVVLRIRYDNGFGEINELNLGYFAQPVPTFSHREVIWLFTPGVHRLDPPGRIVTPE